MKVKTVPLHRRSPSSLGAYSRLSQVSVINVQVVTCVCQRNRPQESVFRDMLMFHICTAASEPSTSRASPSPTSIGTALPPQSAAASPSSTPTQAAAAPATASTTNATAAKSNTTVTAAQPTASQPTASASAPTTSATSAARKSQDQVQVVPLACIHHCQLLDTGHVMFPTPLTAIACITNPDCSL